MQSLSALSLELGDIPVRQKGIRGPTLQLRLIFHQYLLYYLQQYTHTDICTYTFYSIYHGISDSIYHGISGIYRDISTSSQPIDIPSKSRYPVRLSSECYPPIIQLTDILVPAAQEQAVYKTTFIKTTRHFRSHKSPSCVTTSPIRTTAAMLVHISRKVNLHAQRSTAPVNGANRPRPTPQDLPELSRANVMFASVVELTRTTDREGASLHWDCICS